MSAKAAIRRSDLGRILDELAKRGLGVGRIVMRDGEVTIDLTGERATPPDEHPADEWHRVIHGESQPAAAVRSNLRGQARTDAALLQARRLAKSAAT